ncbi:unnamed protein product [Rhizoctonia solani]|uniref:AAA+ ATPase domain-containing protein n=1 Tax=Rhizoctonia solani TaxID=456999 RepID=A0A8H3ASA0_9AGAM|nr:unnamed protein product [Rhizoctonia solani]
MATKHSNHLLASAFDDALTQLSQIFNSSAAHGTAEPQSETSVNQPALILYSPIEGGEGVIDLTVKLMAESTDAFVKEIDILQLVSEQPKSFWTDLSKAEGNEGSESDSDSEDNNAAGYFNMQEPINNAKLSKLVDSAISKSNNPSEVGEQPKSNRHIVYIRDFGFLATFAPTCYKRIVDTVLQRRSQDGNDKPAEISTAVILGASPLLIKGGLFQKESSKKRGRRDSSPGPSFMSFLMSLRPESQSNSENSSLDDWGEGKDAEKLRDQRLRQQHEMWNNGSLTDHIHTHLGRTRVLAGGSSQSKRLPTCVVVPTKRDPKQERLAREKRRLELNWLQVQMALLATGGELNNKDRPSESGESPDDFTSKCKGNVVGYGAIKRVADRAMGQARASPESSGSAPITITWEEYCAAWSAEEQRDRERANWMKSSVPTKQAGSEDNDTDGKSPSEDGDAESEVDTVDPLVEWVKKQGLTSYEEKMLNCLVRPADIPTGFDAVHLPDATIDAIRTLVSLRLICPEAFETGILKQNNMSGALLFGPPGTGKTHLAKAVAKESGARMISIKASDIHEKYVGEGEKSIEALFKLARRLKPCIIFIDEADALFGARVAAKDNCSRWRTDMLTQFTQEMDGMLSSDVVVIGATNRPADLDDAILRRLPCRVLVELPDPDAREAILSILLKDEQLDSDVSLKDLADRTPTYSGSDLKNLCVKAAFESAKELANVSWTDKKWKKMKPSSSGISTPPASDSGTNGARPNTPTYTRKLAKRHFMSALKEVRASTSEKQTSLTELRRWNEQFGSGGQSGRTGGYSGGTGSYSGGTSGYSGGTGGYSAGTGGYSGGAGGYFGGTGGYSDRSGGYSGTTNGYSGISQPASTNDYSGSIEGTGNNGTSGQNPPGLDSNWRKKLGISGSGSGAMAGCTFGPPPGTNEMGTSLPGASAVGAGA